MLRHKIEQLNFQGRKKITWFRTACRESHHNWLFLLQHNFPALTERNYLSFTPKRKAFVNQTRTEIQ